MTIPYWKAQKIPQQKLPPCTINVREFIHKALQTHQREELTEIVVHQLSQLPYPYSLFRYREYNSYNTNSLANGKLYFSTPDNFNDPFEFYFNLSQRDTIPNALKDSDLNIPEITALQSQYKEQDYQTSRDALTEFLICCFMEEPTSLLMWSHYAKDHTGFCIEYDFSNSCFYEFLLPVYYVDSVISYKLGGDFLQACIVKSDDWGYENEWRMIYSNNGINKQVAPPVKSIYLGSKMEDAHVQDIVNIAKSLTPNPKVYKMDLSHTEYKLTEKEI